MLMKSKVQAAAEAATVADEKPIVPPFLCGLVLFDHPSDISVGSAFLPETPIQRIRSLNDVRNDILWLSNLSIFEDKIKNHPVVRSQIYLKIALSDIAQDIGIQCSQDGQMQINEAQRMAEILTRVMTVATRAYGWASEDQRAKMTEDLYLSSSLAKCLPQSPIPDARSREELSVVFNHCYQESSAPAWNNLPYRPNSRFITLRFNYVNYVNQLLSQPVPQGKEWQYFNERAVSLMDDPLDFCLNLSKPCFIRATVEWDNASSDMASLAAYGQAGKKRNPMRLWMSQAELKWISRYASITISSIWIDESGYGLLPVKARLPELFELHPESYLSYSAHLVALNHYHALTGTRWNRRRKSAEADLWGMWIKSLDRGFMFSMALKAHEAGLHVYRYGDGALSLHVEKEQLDEALVFKTEQGFMYPDFSLLMNNEID